MVESLFSRPSDGYRSCEPIHDGLPELDGPVKELIKDTFFGAGKELYSTPNPTELADSDPIPLTPYPPRSPGYDESGHEPTIL